MVTGRISFFRPVYSPTWSSVRLVLSSSSRIHWRTATVLGVRTSAAHWALCMAAMPTSVLPAPQGRTTTPLPPAAAPPAQKTSAASTW